VFGPASIEVMMRERIRATIEALVEEELDAALGAAKSRRVGEARSGYRQGSRPRQLTTSLGRTTIAMPRARLASADGSTTEWRRRMIGRYQRRTEGVDEAILGVYSQGRTRGGCAEGSRRCFAGRRCRRTGWRA
jgi:putative transposase